MTARDDLKKRAAEENAEIRAALNVDGCHGFLAFDDDIFLLDYWDSEQGLSYLIGVASIVFYTQVEGDDYNEYQRVITLDHDFYTEHDQSHIVYAFKNILQRLKRIWGSGEHGEHNPPRYYIEWAIRKKHEIPWLQYAIDKGFYKPMQPSINESKDKPLSPRTENNYLRLILTLANSIKDFNPKKPYEAAQLIINETGIGNISKQTIADYITKAYKIESKERD